MKTDLYTACVACVKGTLSDNIPEYDNSKKVLGVVLVSGGYPGSYKKGCSITGIKGYKETRHI